MDYVLSNDQLRVTVNSMGAELKSLVMGGREYIWQADPAFWARSCPVLFPIVGKLKDNRYTFEGNTYELPQHGFARDLEFRLSEKRADTLAFTLLPDETTLAKYPFRFQLGIFYVLTADTLEVTFRVSNLGKAPMPASIGGHPGFTLPGNRSYLEIPGAEQLECHELQDGLRNGNTRVLGLEQHRLAIKPDTFAKDALVLKNFQAPYIRLAAEDHDSGMDFSFGDCSWFGIWSKPGAPFVCLEPWKGVADSIQHHGNLLEKEAILQIPPAGFEELHYTIKPW